MSRSVARGLVLRRSLRRAGALLAAASLIAACATDTVTAPASSTSDLSPAVKEPSQPEPSGLTEEPSQPEPSGLTEEPSQPEPPAAVEEPSDPEPSGLAEEPSQRPSSSVVERPASTEGQSEAAPEASVFPTIGDGEGVARWTVEIVESVPHDPDAFTQGLEVDGGTMYESTGLWGQSSLRAVNPVTGEVAARVDLPEEFFGEGLTVVGDEIIQLTWQSGTALVYDRSTLVLVREYSYDGEGWGLCEMGGELIMSDGSDRLARRDPHTFELLGAVTVTATGYDGRLDHLNELECVESLVIANVWQTDNLLVIDPGDGQVVAAIDAGPLADDVSQSRGDREIDVLNGVAVDEKSATLWMTGKLWPRLYRVRIMEVP